MPNLRVVLMVIVMSSLVPAVALADGAPQTLTDLATLILKLIGAATGMLITLGIVIYFYGIFMNMGAFSEGNPEKFRSFFFWGLIALFMMVSLWGIINILSQTVFNGNPPGTTTG